MYKAAVSSAVMSSLHGMKIAAFVQPWSVMVSIVADDSSLRQAKDV
jgi:hypothetical protein